MSASWDALDDVVGRVKVIAEYLEAYGQDATELEKALRVVEARRGELLPQVAATRGGRSHDWTGTELEKALRVVEARRGQLLALARVGQGNWTGTQRRWRQIARNWDWLWPEKGNR